MNKGLLLIELIIVIIIAAILATLALPNYSRTTENHRGRAAETNLWVIYHAQKRYKLDNGLYFTACNPCTTDAINTGLGLSLVDRNFTYSMQVRNPNGFEATATRRGSGLCGGRTMTITDASGVVQKGCDAW